MFVCLLPFLKLISFGSEHSELPSCVPPATHLPIPCSKRGNVSKRPRSSENLYLLISESLRAALIQDLCWTVLPTDQHTYLLCEDEEHDVQWPYGLAGSKKWSNKDFTQNQLPHIPEELLRKKTSNTVLMWICSGLETNPSNPWSFFVDGTTVSLRLLWGKGWFATVFKTDELWPCPLFCGGLVFTLLSKLYEPCWNQLPKTHTCTGIDRIH